METFFQAAALVVVGVILCLSLGKERKETAVLLSLAVCAMAALTAGAFLSPVLDFLRELSDLAGLESSVLTILLKVLGIGLISQLAQLLCADSGNGAMGKALQILAGAVTFWLALPLFRSLLELVRGVLSGG